MLIRRNVLDRFCALATQCKCVRAREAFNRYLRAKVHVPRGTPLSPHFGFMAPNRSQNSDKSSSTPNSNLIAERIMPGMNMENAQCRRWRRSSSLSMYRILSSTRTRAQECGEDVSLKHGIDNRHEIAVGVFGVLCLCGPVYKFARSCTIRRAYFARFAYVGRPLYETARIADKIFISVRMQPSALARGCVCVCAWLPHLKLEHF